MASVLDRLQAVDPSIQSQAAADFRSTIAAIAKELHSASGAEQRSLQQWWQWLDEEGYDHDGVIQILRQVCRARIGADGLEALTASCAPILNDPDGIAALLDVLEPQHADLSRELQELEDACLAEQAELEATAGGVSKGGKIGLYSLAGGVLIVGGVFLYKQRRRGETMQDSYEYLVRQADQKATDLQWHAERVFQTTEEMTPAEANATARALATKYRNYGHVFDIDKAAQAFAKDPKSEAKNLVFDLVARRVNGLASPDEQALMADMGIDGWQPGDFNKVTNQDCVDFLEEYPSFSEHAAGELLYQAKLDLLKNIKIPAGDTPEFRTFLQENEQFLTSYGRQVLAGEAAVVRGDAVVEIDGLGEQIEGLGEQAVSRVVAPEVAEGELLAGDAVREVRSDVGQVLETDLTNAEQLADQAERAAMDDL